MSNFSDIPLYRPFVKALASKGIIRLTPIQEKVIPPALEGKSIFFESETGTGKTYAFLLPLLTNLMRDEKQAMLPRILILSPTAELAAQIKEAASHLNANGESPIKIALCVGGTSLKRQIDALKEKPALIIGTPLRISDLIGLKKLKLKEVSAAVIDEADRQLAKESRDALQTVLAALPQHIQILACSATFNDKNSELLKSYLPHSAALEACEYIVIPRTHVLQHSIEHWALLSERRDKADTLRALIHALNSTNSGVNNSTAARSKKILIFTAPAQEVETLANKLRHKKLDAAPLYGNMDSAARKQLLAQFRSGKQRLVVTTDVSARGLDIVDIDYIVQMHLTKDADLFIHRAGRTARAGRHGVNIVIGDAYELRILQSIEKKLGITVYPKILNGGKIETVPQE